MIRVLTAAIVLAWGPPGDPTEPWREIRYAGRTRYQITSIGQDVVLRADSRDRNSALVQPLDLDPRGFRVRWRWRVLKHPEQADPEVRARDDRAAAVIVIVRKSMLPWRTRALLYQWTPTRTQGEWSASPYSANVRTLVVESAPADTTWRSVERDLVIDLTAAFGVLPASIEAIGVICDTDNTGSDAAAEFGPIVLVPGEPTGP
jgi:hypothetical protein